MKDIFQLLKFTLAEKKKLTLSLIFTAFVAFFTLVFVNLVQPIMDEMLNPKSQAVEDKARVMDFIFDMLNVTKDDITKVIPVLLVVVIFGKGLFTFLSAFLMKSIGHKTVRKLRNELYEHIIYQSTNYFDHVPTGELMSRLTNDVEKIQQAVSGNMGDLIRETLILLALVIGVFVFDWRLALASLIIAPLAFIPLAVFSRSLKKKGKQNQVRMAEIYRLLHETITGNKIVKASNPGQLNACFKII